jgi:hypothetical protein
LLGDYEYPYQSTPGQLVSRDDFANKGVRLCQKMPTGNDANVTQFMMILMPTNGMAQMVETPLACTEMTVKYIYSSTVFSQISCEHFSGKNSG